MRNPLPLLLIPLAMMACSDQVGPDPVDPDAPSTAVHAANTETGVNPHAYLLPPVGPAFEKTGLEGEEADVLGLLRVRVVLCTILEPGDPVPSDIVCDEHSLVADYTAEDGGMTYGSGEAEYQANIDLRELTASPDPDGQTWIYRAIAQYAIFPELDWWQEIASADIIALANGNARKSTPTGFEEIATTAAHLPFKIFAAEGMMAAAQEDAAASVPDLDELPESFDDPEMQGVCQVLDSSGEPLCSLTIIPVDEETTAVLAHSNGQQLAAIQFAPGAVKLPAVLLLSSLSTGQPADCGLGRIPEGLAVGNCVGAFIFPEQPLGDFDGDGEVALEEGEGVPGAVCSTLQSGSARTVKFDAGRTPEFTLPPRVLADFLDCTSPIGFLDSPVRWLAAQTLDILAPPLYARDLKGTQLRDLSHLIDMEAVEFFKVTGDGVVATGSIHDLTVQFRYEHHHDIEGCFEGCIAGAENEAFFEVTDGAGHLLVGGQQVQSASVYSDENGRATIEFVPADGSNEVTVTSPDALPAEGWVFTVTAESVPVDIIK